MLFLENSSVTNWLLESNQPSVRYLVLTELLGKSNKDSDVKSARGNITKFGWAKDMLDELTPSETWNNKARIWEPKYVAPFWRLLVLSDLGLTKKEAAVDKACQVWMKRFATADGGFSAFSKNEGHLCITGNMARALVKFGYADHPKVRRAFQWFVKTQSDRGGGWSCWNFGNHRGGRNLDSWEPLSAFAVYPRQKWTRGMKSAAGKGAEFYLQRGLHRQGSRYEPWYRFHYPHHYCYDLLVGLDFMTALGYSADKRLGYAISLLKEKRRSDGRWNLDAETPDPEDPQGKWDKAHPDSGSIHLTLERAGKPSEMITLTALKILNRIRE